MINYLKWWKTDDIFWKGTKQSADFASEFSRSGADLSNLRRVQFRLVLAFRANSLSFAIGKTLTTSRHSLAKRQRHLWGCPLIFLVSVALGYLPFFSIHSYTNSSATMKLIIFATASTLSDSFKKGEGCRLRCALCFNLLKSPLPIKTNLTAKDE